MATARKNVPAARVKEFQITVRLTVEGIRDAYDQLSDARARLKAQGRRSVTQLTEAIGPRSTYASDTDAQSDIEAARSEVYIRRNRP